MSNGMVKLEAHTLFSLTKMRKDLNEKVKSLEDEFQEEADVVQDVSIEEGRAYTEESRVTKSHSSSMASEGLGEVSPGSGSGAGRSVNTWTGGRSKLVMVSRSQSTVSSWSVAGVTGTGVRSTTPFISAGAGVEHLNR